MMDLSRREQIAIGILVACARSGERRIHTEQAAATAGSSAVQTAQLVHRLQRSHLLDTVRGRQGGICLARRADQITLEDVLRAVGAKRRAGMSAEGNPEGALAAIAQIAARRARETYQSFTIADLAREAVADKLACFACSIRLGAVPRARVPVRGKSPPALTARA